MKTSAATSRTTLSLCALGVALHAYETARAVTAQPDGGNDLGGVLFLGGLLLWSCLPYAIWAYVAAVKGHALPAVGGALGVLLFDLWMHYSVFVAPAGSTAAIALLFAPAWNLVLFGPLGAALVWAVRKLLARQKHAT